jgi:UDP-N-acetylglucosamine diphosphorylase/glucosamine-1-phosphate N-acetyltransferase
MRLVIFDDNKEINFYPLTLNRSTGDLRVGILKLRQRVAAYFEEDEYDMIVHKRLARLTQERHPKRRVNSLIKDEYLFVNSRLIIHDDLASIIRELSYASILVRGSTVLAARLELPEGEYYSEMLPEIFAKLTQKQYDSAECWEYTWELIENNAEYISKDFFDFFYEEDNFFDTELGVTILNPYNAWIGDNVDLKPGVVIDCSDGPVVIDEEATVMHNSVIIGPVYIGKGSIIKAGATIYEGTSIGKKCKVGGEVVGTIIQGYSNKQHSGFLGHAYIGEWVNIGAGTNNSDLKNNYRTVKCYFHPEKEIKDSGKQFLGTIIGDHTKIGINCAINTGTVIGIGCNLYGSRLIKGHIPSFSWGESGDLVSYQVESFGETVRIVKGRRKLTMSESEKELLTPNITEQ